MEVFANANFILLCKLATAMISTYLDNQDTDEQRLNLIEAFEECLDVLENGGKVSE